MVDLKPDVSEIYRKACTKYLLLFIVFVFVSADTNSILSFLCDCLCQHLSGRWFIQLNFQGWQFDCNTVAQMSTLKLKVKTKWIGPISCETIKRLHINSVQTVCTCTFSDQSKEDEWQKKYMSQTWFGYFHPLNSWCADLSVNRILCSVSVCCCGNRAGSLHIYPCVHMRVTAGYHFCYSFFFMHVKTGKTD